MGRQSQGTSGVFSGCYGDEPHPTFPAQTSRLCQVQCPQRQLQGLLQPFPAECLRKPPPACFHFCASQTPESQKDMGVTSEGVPSAALRSHPSDGGASGRRETRRDQERLSWIWAPPCLAGCSFPEAGVGSSFWKDARWGHPWSFSPTLLSLNSRLT